MSRFSDPDQPDSTSPRRLPASFTHTPGLTDDMLAELTPLLEAEGIDLDHLDSVAPGALQSAMESAVERRNMELFTPTGARRIQALAVLRAFTEATAGHNTDRAQAILDAVEPEETDTLPAISHVLGAGLGLLDSWFADRRYRKALAAARVSSRRRPVRASATDVLAAARRRAAFASLDDLTIDHGGLALFEGVATVVAGAVAAIAKRERRPVARMAADLLIRDADYATVEVGLAPEGRGFGYAETPAPASGEEQQILAQFRAWLARQDQIMAPNVDDEVETLRAVFALARRGETGLVHPDGMETVVAMLLDMGSDGEEDSHDAMVACLYTLDEYVHFQWDRAEDPEDWDDAHDIVERALDDTAPDDPAMADAMDAAQAVAPQVRIDAQLGSRISAAVPQFLEWLGQRRPVTQSGYLRLSDIGTVAAMLGVRAQGVRKMPDEAYPQAQDLSFDAPLPDPATFFARSMIDVPVLDAWWKAMLAAGILVTNTSSARPGPNAGLWLGDAAPPLDLLEQFTRSFVALTLGHGLTWDDSTGAEHMVSIQAAIRTLLAAAPDVEAPQTDQAFSTMMKPRALQRLVRLRNVGLLEDDGSGGFHVPEGMRAAVMSAAMAILQVATADPDEFLDEP